MPADDLILNVRQIAGFPPASVTGSSDTLVIQRGGLGGPFASISPTALVATALSQGGGMAVGGQITAASIQTAAVQASNISVNLIDAETACVTSLNATWGSIGTLNATGAQLGALNVAGDMQLGGVANFASAVVQTNLTVGGASQFSALTVSNLEVCNIATIETGLIVNGNVAVPNGTLTVGGYPVVTSGNTGGLAPIDSPAFTGTPTAPTPSIGPTPPTDNSNAVATTAFVVGVTNQLASQVSTLFAPLASPNFSGVPSAPTAAPGSSTAQLATTAFVMAAVASGVAGVSSFNTRTGAVVLDAADITEAGGALLASPAFTGSPSAPTATTGNASGILATTQFVQNAVAALNLGVTSFNSRTGAVTLTPADITGAGGALAASAGVSSFNGRSGAITLLANDVSAAGALVNPSPTLSGVPTAPTAAPATNTTQLATTAFVTAALATLGGVISFNGRSGAVNLTLADVTGVNGAPINSPYFSGTPQAPTAAPATNTNQIATCAWVLNELGGAMIGVTSFNGRGGAVVLSSADITGAGGALAGDGVTSFNARSGAITLTANDITAAGGAVLASPAFTGTPTSTTATAGTNSTQIATTAFVMAGIAAAGANYLPRAGGTMTGQIVSSLAGAGAAINAINSGGNPSMALSTATQSAISLWYFDVAAANVVLAYSAAWLRLQQDGSFAISGGTAFKPGGGSWAVSSDARVKRDVEDYAGGLDQVCALRPVAYVYNGEGGTTDDGKVYHGLIAQEAREAMPEMVFEAAGLLAMDTTPLMFALVNAVKTLAARVSALEAT